MTPHKKGKGTVASFIAAAYVKTVSIQLFLRRIPVVPKDGLEPSRSYAPRDFKSLASTNSATPAARTLLHKQARTTLSQSAVRYQEDLFLSLNAAESPGVSNANLAAMIVCAGCLPAEKWNFIENRGMQLPLMNNSSKESSLLRKRRGLCKSE